MESQLISAFKAMIFGTVSEADVARHCRFEKALRSPSALTTTNALAETVVDGPVKMKCRLVDLELIPDAAVTGAATDFFSVVVRKRTAAAPGTQVAIATFAADTVTTDDIAAFAAKALLVSPYKDAVAETALDFAEGDVLTVQVTKAGSGMTFPIATVRAEFEPRD